MSEEGVRFTLVEPEEVDFVLNLDAPSLDVSELSMPAFVSLLTASYYLNDQDLPLDDLCARFNVTPESVEALVKTKLPTYCWWRCVLSRSREVEKAAPEEEVNDWGIIGSMTMGFYGLHLAFDDYPLAIPEMQQFYKDLVLLQQAMSEAGHTPKVQAVSCSDVDVFLEKFKSYEEALERRIQALSKVPLDTAVNRPFFQRSYSDLKLTWSL